MKTNLNLSLKVRECCWPEINKLLVISVAKWVYLGSTKYWNLGMDFLGGSVSKEFACGTGDLGLSPGLERSPGGGHGNPL